jgi:hypothetical protein
MYILTIHVKYPTDMDDPVSPTATAMVSRPRVFLNLLDAIAFAEQHATNELGHQLVSADGRIALDFKPSQRDNMPFYLNEERALVAFAKHQHKFNPWGSTDPAGFYYLIWEGDDKPDIGRMVQEVRVRSDLPFLQKWKELQDTLASLGADRAWYLSEHMQKLRRDESGEARRHLALFEEFVADMKSIGIDAFTGEGVGDDESGCE